MPPKAGLKETEFARLNSNALKKPQLVHDSNDNSHNDKNNNTSSLKGSSRPLSFL